MKHPSDDNAQPTLAIPVTGFTHLWTRFKQRHVHLPTKEFHEQLYALLARETEGKTRTTGGKVNFSNFWCTPPSLLRIFLELFHLSVERFCNPLNFSPLFSSATTGSIEDAFWGFDFDALRANWAELFGFLNPEFTDSTTDVNAPSMIKCILKARAAATATTDQPVRNVALLPFHPDCPKTYEALKTGHHTQKILITFPPETFSFWPYQVHLGTRSPFGFTPYRKTLALVIWENEAAAKAFPLADQHLDALAN